MTDAEILTALQAGDERALSALNNRLRKALEYHSIKLQRDPHTAEEIVNDALLQIWDLAHKFDAFSGLNGYLFTIVRNNSLNAYHQKARLAKQLRHFTQQAPPQIVDFEREMLEAEVMAAQTAKLEAAIELLPTRQRQILRLFLIHGMTPSEIARVLGLNGQSVRNLKRLALQLIRGSIHAPALVSVSEKKAQKVKKRRGKKKS